MFSSRFLVLDSLLIAQIRTEKTLQMMSNDKFEGNEAENIH